MKSFAVRILFVVCILNLNAGFAQQADTNDYQIIDGVIAVVGRNMIKESELETSFLQAKSQVGIMENAFDTRCNIFESMLINKLMLHQAEIDSIEVTDEEITRELDSRIKQMIRMYGSQEVMEKMMKKSVSEIKTIYRDLIRENIMIAQIDQKLTGTINITPQEVVDFYQSIPQDSLPVIEQEYRFAQIVKLPEISDEEKEAVKSRLNDYRERILKGSKFSTLATLYSDDPASAKQGGELGFFSRGDMVAEFENNFVGMVRNPSVESVANFYRTTDKLRYDADTREEFFEMLSEIPPTMIYIKNALSNKKFYIDLTIPLFSESIQEWYKNILCKSGMLRA